MKNGNLNITCKSSEEITFDVKASNGEVISFKQIFNPTNGSRHKVTFIAPMNVKIKRKSV